MTRIWKNGIHSKEGETRVSQKSNLAAWKYMLPPRVSFVPHGNFPHAFELPTVQYNFDKRKDFKRKCLVKRKWKNKILGGTP